MYALFRMAEKYLLAIYLRDCLELCFDTTVLQWGPADDCR